MRAVAASLAALSALVAAPAARADDVAAPAKRAYSVAAIGDSLTDPKAQGGKYLDLLRERCPASRFDAYGRGGQMVNQMRARFARDIFGDASDDGPAVDKPRYTHVIVFGGVNDLYSDRTAGRTVAKIEADLAAMYSMAHARGVAVVALTVAPWGGFSRYYNERRGRATAELNRWIGSQLSDPSATGARAGTVDAVVDTVPLLSCGDPTRLCPRYARKDQIHWTALGQQRLGEELHAKLFADCR